MPEQAATEGKNNNDRPKKLYEVLAEEYRRLGIFSAAEAKAILDKEKQHPFYDSKDEKKRRALGEFLLAELRHAIHAKVKADKKHTKPFAALCFSGGGIRSATFNLGILQGLARHKLLDKFHYLSTVSGGGYIGSWLSAWIYRKRLKAKSDFNREDDFSADFVREVQKELAPKRHDESVAAKGEHIQNELHDVEPLEIKHLRSYSNYMSPRPGLFTTDTWTLIVVYLRNLLLNWTVLVPLLAAVLLLPRLFYAVLGKTMPILPNYFSHESVFFLVSCLSLSAGIVGVAYMIAMRPTLRKYFWSDTEKAFATKREPLIRTLCVSLILVLAFGFTVFRVWFMENSPDNLPDILYFVCFGAGLFVAGGLGALIYGMIKKPQRVETDKKTFYFWGEVMTSIISGGAGGALLYLSLYLITKYTSTHPENLTLIYACFGVPLFLIVFLLTATIFVGIASKITDDMDREWLSRFGALLLIFAVVWSVMSSVVLLGQMLFEDTLFNDSTKNWVKGAIASIGGLSGLITLVLGFSRKSDAKDDKAPKSTSGFLLWFAPQIAAPIFAVFLMILIAYGTYLLMLFAGENIDWLRLPIISKGDNVKLIFPNFLITLLWIALLAGIGILMGFFVNINKFSLHATYRERLIRSYLGASRAEERLKTENSFTGLDDKDNVEMKELLQRPFHVVNMTLNLANSKNLRWQNRKAESFTSTALHSGSSNMEDGIGSYRDSDWYGYNKQSCSAISLGTAAAISGAAASPNMGYYTSSKAVSFLMALFNVRLGWWLGNPGATGSDTYNLSAPKWSPKVFFAEALGLTDDRHKYVYLSDGGHFDNLGLYEMVLRRVNLIVCCDSGADLDFGFNDFGTAIHKIRVDMGIPIEFEKQSDIPTAGRNCGIATIKYKEIDGENAENGTLIYIKPTLDGDEPIDLINYKKSNPAFPHEGTADQMYSETQFESYRKLGAHMINSFCCGDKDNIPCIKCSELSNLLDNANDYLKEHGKEKEIGNKKKDVEKKY
ncbi:MAG: patatin-like phospholipase family protein [Pyrinomonadaceae bacterium]